MTGSGSILDVAVTTRQTKEGEITEPQVGEIEAVTGIDIKTSRRMLAMPMPRSMTLLSGEASML